MRIFKFIKFVWRFTGRLPWVESPDWNVEDANGLKQFLCSQTGKKLRMTLLNSVIRQNSHAVTQKKDLEFEAGFANGMRSTVHILEVLAQEVEPAEEFTSDVYGAEHLASQGPNGTADRFGASFGRF